MTMKKQSRGLFDPPESLQDEQCSSSTESATTQEETKIKDPCPRCGGRSLKTKRAFEHQGHTHYCATACLSDDRMDNFYFTPAPESFQEQAESEENKKKAREAIERETPAQEAQRKAFEEVERVIAQTPEIAEMDSVLEQVDAATKIIASEVPGVNDGDVMPWSGAAIEGEQQTLIDAPTRWEEEWKGMPEFVQKDLKPFHSVTVHLESREDLDAFAKLVKQKLGTSTPSIWWPEKTPDRNCGRKYVAD